MTDAELKLFYTTHKNDMAMFVIHEVSQPKFILTLDEVLRLIKLIK